MKSSKHVSTLKSDRRPGKSSSQAQQLTMGLEDSKTYKQKSSGAERQRTRRTVEVSAMQVAQLRDQTKCGLHLAMEALMMREGILEFAVEYVDRVFLPNLSEEKKFPQWTAYRQMLGEKV